MTIHSPIGPHWSMYGRCWWRLTGTLPTSLPNAWLDYVTVHSYWILPLSHNCHIAMPYSTCPPHPTEYLRFIGEMSPESKTSSAFLKVCFCFSPACHSFPCRFYLMSSPFSILPMWAILYIIYQLFQKILSQDSLLMSRFLIYLFFHSFIK